MPVFISQSHSLPSAESYRYWANVLGTDVSLNEANRLPDIAERLEKAIIAIGPLWIELGRNLSKEPSAVGAHMPTCGIYGSDFGQYLAWFLVVQELADHPDPILIICDDPWVFRQLASIPGVESAPPPAIFKSKLTNFLRGWLARLNVTARALKAQRSVQKTKSVFQPKDPVLLVYGHPDSRTDGYDSYFGTLMRDIPSLKRLLHTDCPAHRALELFEDGKTGSLHAWGSPLFAVTRMPFARWHPSRDYTNHPFAWLIKRAVSLENSRGGIAMNRWQHHCQANWLKACRPSVVCWPWENHGWERQFCRVARDNNVTTVGYLHTTIGPWQYNFSINANYDGLASAPDKIISNGPATRGEMIDWGYPAAQIDIGGAFRLKRPDNFPYDPDGAIFFPLSATPSAQKIQLTAAKIVADAGYHVLVKEHPMYPVSFKETETLKRTTKTFNLHDHIGAMIYATGTSGMEGLLAKVPTYRLRLKDSVGMEVLPPGLKAITITEDDLPEILKNPVVPNEDWNAFLSDPDLNVWISIFKG